MFLGCTSAGRVDLWFLWFFVQEYPKTQPAVILVLKRLRRRDNGLKSRPTDLENRESNLRPLVYNTTAAPKSREMGGGAAVGHNLFICLYTLFNKGKTHLSLPCPS